MELPWRWLFTSIFYFLRNSRVSLSLSSLETKHAAATKSLLFYPVAWPMDTYNMYMQLHFYMPTHTYVSFPIIIIYYAHVQDVMWAVVIYLDLCVCVCMCACVCVCEREREREREREGERESVCCVCVSVCVCVCECVCVCVCVCVLLCFDKSNV